MKQKTKSKSNAPLAKILYIAIAGFVVVQTYQTITIYSSMTEQGRNQDSAAMMAMGFIGFGVLLPLVLAVIIWMTGSKKRRGKQSFFDSSLIAIGMLAIIIGGGSLTTIFSTTFANSNWILFFVMPFIVACATVVIMLRRLRMRGEW